jgi:hypothetical protein
MLLAEPTAMGAGVILWGDARDLTSLHGTITRIAGAAPPHLSDVIVALAYDVRHASEGIREKKSFGDVAYLGTRVVWPRVLMQAVLLRQYAAFVDTSREDQSNLFRLEHALRQALRDYDAADGNACAQWLERPLCVSRDYLASFVDHVATLYVAEEPGGNVRFGRLPAILRGMNELSSAYRAYRRVMESMAAERGCDAQDLHAREDCPEFTW